MPKSKLDYFAEHSLPPLLILLLLVAGLDLTIELGNYAILVDFLDLLVMTIFGIDLYFRWLEIKVAKKFFKRYLFDFIAFIPFHFIFYGVPGMSLIRGLRILRWLWEFSRYGRVLSYGKVFFKTESDVLKKRH